MSDHRDEEEFERRLDEVAQSLRDVADQISALRDYVPRRRDSAPEGESAQADDQSDVAKTDEADVRRHPEIPGAQRGDVVVGSDERADAVEASGPTFAEPGPEPADESPEDAEHEAAPPPERGTPAYRPPTDDTDKRAAEQPDDATDDAEAPGPTREQPPEQPDTVAEDTAPSGGSEQAPTPESAGPAAQSDGGASSQTEQAGQRRRGAAEPNDGDAEEEKGDGFRVENWIDKIGIALVLLGVAFLYKLSVEMGLVTPPIKVFLGGIVSTTLLGIGLKIRKKRRGLAQIMMGGASAGYYLSVFAASQIYELIGDPVALGATLGIAAGTFGLAIREDTPALTVVGAIGAFATPFFLEASNAGQLLAFNAIIVAGMTAIYVYKGWTALLLTYSIGAWVVVLYAVGLQLDDAFLGAADATIWADLLAQVGLTIAWLATGVVPTLREWMRARDTGEIQVESGSLDSLLIFGLALIGPVFYQVAAHVLWDWSGAGWAAFDVAWAVGAALLASRLQGVGSDLFTGAFRFVALMFGTMAIFEFFDGEWLPAALAIEGAAICYAGRRLDDTLLRAVGHSLVMGTSVVLLTTLDFTTDPEWAFLNAEFLRAGIIISALVAVSVDEDVEWFEVGYRYLAHGLILLVVLDQTMGLEHGRLVCTAIWGAYAIGVLVGGTILDSRQTTIVGFLTIVLTAGKLIAFDMADTETIWRVAVFIGFGGALLLTSYMVPGLARRRGDDEADEAAQEESPPPDSTE
jgi:uncharacterized membrane protein